MTLSCQNIPRHWRPADNRLLNGAADDIHTALRRETITRTQGLDILVDDLGPSLKIPHEE
jgi:hypothetical protein